MPNSPAGGAPTGGPPAGGPPVEDVIRARGPITFRDFMEMALYYPGLGYYCQGKDRVGASGDFYSSPTTHPVFGTLLAVQLRQMWELTGRPADFTVIEAGAGKGLLAKDVTSYLPHLGDEFARAVNYFAVERNKVFSGAGPIENGGPGGATAPDHICGCVLSNELLDALPVHKVILRNGELLETYVTLQDGWFREMERQPSTPRLQEYLEHEGISLVEGQIAEINLDGVDWLRDNAARLDKGYVLTIDYGYPARELYSPERKQGTLVTYFRHVTGTNPYTNIGEQDLTTHVDFTGVALAGERAGLSTLGLISQGEFLRNLGFKAFMNGLRSKGLPYNEYLENRFALMELVRPEGFGDFKVLLQEKGMGKQPLCGLTGDNGCLKELLHAGKALEVPLLRPEHAPLLRAKYPHLSVPAEFDATETES